jgi:uncharacterized protein (DUF1330 family)
MADADASLTPTAEQLAALAGAADDTPVVMLNLLRYRERAGDGSDRTGREAYLDYGALVAPMVLDRGGSFVYQGDAHQTVIGPAGEAWDEVVLVQYPSRAAFLDMITSEAYLAAHVHREAGLADSRLVALSPNAYG